MGCVEGSNPSVVSSFDRPGCADAQRARALVDGADAKVATPHGSRLDGEVGAIGRVVGANPSVVSSFDRPGGGDAQRAGALICGEDAIDAARHIGCCYGEFSALGCVDGKDTGIRSFNRPGCADAQRACALVVGVDAAIVSRHIGCAYGEVGTLVESADACEVVGITVVDVIDARSRHRLRLP